jgi:hypothetical protein
MSSSSSSNYPHRSFANGSCSSVNCASTSTKNRAALNDFYEHYFTPGPQAAKALAQQSIEYGEKTYQELIESKKGLPLGVTKQSQKIDFIAEMWKRVTDQQRACC